MSKKWKGVKILAIFAEQIDKIVADESSGFVSRADYINSLIREDLKARNNKAASKK